MRRSQSGKLRSAVSEIELQNAEFAAGFQFPLENSEIEGLSPCLQAFAFETGVPEKFGGTNWGRLAGEDSSITDQ